MPDNNTLPEIMTWPEWQPHMRLAVYYPGFGKPTVHGNAPWPHLTAQVRVKICDPRADRSFEIYFYGASVPDDWLHQFYTRLKYELSLSHRN